MKVEYKSEPLKQNWDQELPKYWFDGSPLKTHYMNGLSLIIPILETTVIHTLKETHSELTDPALKMQVGQMIAQENWHSYSHKKYNDWLAKIGLPASELELDFWQATMIRHSRLKRFSGQNAWIPMLVGGEHNAVCIMEYLLEHPAILATMHPHFRQAWVWHCIEEIEHKGTSMDMWYDTQVLYNRKKFKLKFACVGTMLTLNYYSIKYMFALLRHDNELWKWRTLKDGLSFFLGRDGLITKTIVPFFRCLKSSWHPWDHDTRYLIEKYDKLGLATALTAEELKKIDIEFQGCVADMETVIRMNNIKEY